MSNKFTEDDIEMYIKAADEVYKWAKSGIEIPPMVKMSMGILCGLAMRLKYMNNK